MQQIKEINTEFIKQVEDIIFLLRGIQEDISSEKLGELAVVTPIDSCGSKGVSKVFNLNVLENAFDNALELDPKYEPAILNKTLFSATDEGYELPKPSQILSVDYYKDYPSEKKSLIGSFLERKLPHKKIEQQ